MLSLKDQRLRYVTSRRLAFSYRQFEEFYFHVQGQAVQRLDGTMILRNVVNYLLVVFRVGQSTFGLFDSWLSFEMSVTIYQSPSLVTHFFYRLTLKMKGLRSIETYVGTGFSVYDAVNTLVTTSIDR